MAKVVEGRSRVSSTKCDPVNLVFGSIWLIHTFKEITENECVNKRHPFVQGDNVTNTCTISGKRYEIGYILLFGYFSVIRFEIAYRLSDWYQNQWSWM